MMRNPIHPNEMMRLPLLSTVSFAAAIVVHAFAVTAPPQPLPGLLAGVWLVGWFIGRRRLALLQFWEYLRRKKARPGPPAEMLLTLQNAQRQEARLRQELECKNKQLASYSLHLVQKNELLEQVKAGIHQLKNPNHQQNTQALNGLKRLVATSADLDKDWADFKRNFEAVHQDFYQVLKANHPHLTNHELKLCTLLKLNLNVKEAATILGISPESVKKARYRLRKKMGLPHESNLVDYIICLENNAVLLKDK